MSNTPDIDSLRQQWVAAFNGHDLDAHVALYTPSAMLFGSNDTLHRGQEGIRNYFGGLPAAARVHNYPTPETVFLSDDVAVTAALVDFADGDRLLPYRLTWTVVRRNGDWKIAQHHGSPQQAGHA